MNIGWLVGDNIAREVKWSGTRGIGALGSIVDSTVLLPALIDC
jgi:hypothetical protein